MLHLLKRKLNNEYLKKLYNGFAVLHLNLLHLIIFNTQKNSKLKYLRPILNSNLHAVFYFTRLHVFTLIILTSIVFFIPDCCQPKVGENEGNMRFTEVDRC